MDEVFPNPKYRPIPMAWFAAAAVGQSVGLALLFLGAIAIWRAEPHLILAAGAMWTGYLLFRLWPRKLASAPLAWRLATVTMLAVQFGMFAYACLTPVACADVYQHPSAACLAQDEKRERSKQP